VSASLRVSDIRVYHSAIIAGRKTVHDILVGGQSRRSRVSSPRRREIGVGGHPATLILTVLGGLAEFERTLIKARCADGIKRAKAQGEQAKLTPHQAREARARREAGDSITEIARTYGVHHSTISRLRWRA
jgi:Helix-turn-helix domain/Resolvase, N terminal domain